MHKIPKLFKSDLRPPMNETEIKAYWDKFSVLYTKHHEKKTLINAYEQLERVIEKGKGKGRFNYLELGCGSGRLAECILNNRRDCFKKMLFTDISSSMVDLTKERLKPFDNGQPVIEIQQKNAEELFDLDKHRFDIVFGSLMIHLVENPENVYKGIKHCLKPDGLVYLSYITGLEQSTFFSEYNRLVSKYIKIVQDKRQMFYFGEENHLERLNLMYGFDLVERTDFDVIIGDSAVELKDLLKQAIEFTEIEKSLSVADYKSLLKDTDEYVEDLFKNNKRLKINVTNNILSLKN